MIRFPIIDNEWADAEQDGDIEIDDTDRHEEVDEDEDVIEQTAQESGVADRGDSGDENEDEEESQRASEITPSAEKNTQASTKAHLKAEWDEMIQNQNGL